MLHKKGKCLIVVCDVGLTEKDGCGNTRNNEQGWKNSLKMAASAVSVWTPACFARGECPLDQEEIGAPVTEAQYESEAKNYPGDVEGRSADASKATDSRCGRVLPI